MKVNPITRTVKITIDGATLFSLFVKAVYGDAKISEGKNRTFYHALGNLAGISDTDAVQIANSGIEKEERITVTEFRRWLPTVFAEFARAMLEANDD